LEQEPAQVTESGEPLLQLVVSKGRRVGAQKTLAQLREYHAEQIRKLPPALKALDAQGKYSVAISKALIDLGKETDRSIRRRAKEETVAV
jgi:hypothetical protein